MAHSDALYEAIRKELLQEINAGTYSGGVRLPSEKELSERFYVSRITAKHALNALAEEGVIRRIPGRGSFLAGDNPIQQIKKNSHRRSVALVMGSFSSEFGLDVIRGAVERSEKEDLNLIVKKTYDSQENENNVLKRLLSDGINGIILQPTNGEIYSKEVVEIVYSGFPIVTVDRRLSGIDAPFVGIDNEKTSSEAVGSLLRLGHRNILLLATMNSNSYTQKLRISGYIQAHINAGIAARQDMMLLNMDEERKRKGLPGHHPETHRMLTDVIVNKLREYPMITAIFATESRLCEAALSAMRIVEKQEILSLIGFDAVTDILEPRYTYIAQPQREIGEKAVALMRKMIDKEPLEKREWLLETKMIDGHSVRNVNPMDSEGGAKRG